MLVSHRHKFIFLKPKKTAGTSVEMWLEPLCTPPGHVPQEGTLPIITKYGIVGERSAKAPSANHQYWNHMSAEQLRDTLGASTFDSYKKIATVRNPFDVMVSAFHHFELPSQAAAGLESEDIFAKFRAWVRSRRQTFLSNLPMLMVDGKFCVDILIRYESLEQDMAMCLKKLGFRRSRLGALPETKRKNRIKGIPVSAYYDSETEALVANGASQDFLLLGYSNRVSDIAVAGGDDGKVEMPQTDGIPYLTYNPRRRKRMSEDLIYSVFKEIAVVEGKRNPDGTWNDSNGNDVQRILSRAFSMVQRAANPPAKEEKA